MDFLSNEAIKTHWDSKAISSESYKASWDDFFMVQKEIDAISSHIDGDELICDFGCNNGYTDFQLLGRFDNIKIDGIDYSEKLIQVAKEVLADTKYIKRSNFYVGDILNINTYPKRKYDIVLIKRTIINLETSEDQIQSLLNICNLISKNGKIILLEAVEENWARLNKLRYEFNLPELSQPWHNRYLDESVLKFINNNFIVDVDDDYSSSYYILSRVIYPFIKGLEKDTKLDYLSEIHRMAGMMPNFGDYGTQRMFILRLKN
jgi:ubiquinone/menaquinone biosynthesis C-methylase UbiE